MGSEMCIRDSPFTIWTDHKPLCGALSSSAEKSPRQTRHLSYISEFCTDIRHVAGLANVVADTLSRPPSVCSVSSPSSSPSLQELAREQARLSSEMSKYVDDSRSSLRLQWCSMPDDLKLLCDVSLAPSPPRPVVPSSMVQKIISSSHALAHAGGNALLRDIGRCFVWYRMAADIKQYARSCVPCQRAKVTRHTKTPIAPLDMPDGRFSALHLDLVGPLPESEGKSYLLTIIDRYSRWLEAIPLSDITAKSWQEPFSAIGCPGSAFPRLLSRTADGSSRVISGMSSRPALGSPASSRPLTILKAMG